MCITKTYNVHSNLLEDISEDLNRDIGHIKVVNADDDKVEIFEDRMGRNFNIPKSYWKIDELKRLNSNFKYFDYRGYYFEDYVELLINYNSDYYFRGEYNLKEKLYIDSVFIKIDKPSFIFDVVTNQFYHDRWYDYNEYWTVSLKGITLENYEKYLTQALYLFGINNPPLSFDIFPACYQFTGEYTQDEYLDSFFDFCKTKEEESSDGYSFKNIKYTEAISFYNEGRRLKDREASFYYFYKAIEYFFFICRKDEFKHKIHEYNSDNNIDRIFSFCTEIFKSKELAQLTYLIKTNWDLIMPAIQDIKYNFIEANLCPEKFSEKLYCYRNKIVHGKSETNYERKIINNTGPNEDENYWNCVAEKISNILICKYCLY